MANLVIGRLFRGNLILNGKSYAGSVSECDLPEINWTLADLKTIAQVGKLKAPNGLDDLKATIKGSFDPDLMRAAANPKQAVQIQIRSSYELIDAGGTMSEVPLVAFITGFISKGKPGTIKSLDQASEADFEVHCNTYKLVLDGTTLHDIDLFNNKCVVDGVNVFEQGNANIGV